MTQTTSKRKKGNLVYKGGNFQIVTIYPVYGIIL